MLIFVQNALKMISNIDPFKSFFASVFSVTVGTTYNTCQIALTNVTLDTANTAFQHLAWTVAIIAGIIAIINGIIKIKNSSKPAKNDNED
jgi:hypothetical protein